MKQRTYSAEQLAYLQTKAHFEELKAAAMDIMGECTNDTDEGIDAYIEREFELHRELGTLAAYTAFDKAEQALLDWGIAVTIKYQPGQRAMLQRLAESPILKYRQGAIVLIMKLDIPQDDPILQGVR